MERARLEPRTSLIGTSDPTSFTSWMLDWLLAPFPTPLPPLGFLFLLRCEYPSSAVGQSWDILANPLHLKHWNVPSRRVLEISLPQKNPPKKFPSDYLVSQHVLFFRKLAITIRSFTHLSNGSSSFWLRLQNRWRSNTTFFFGRQYSPNFSNTTLYNPSFPHPKQIGTGHGFLEPLPQQQSVVLPRTEITGNYKQDMTRTSGFL